MAAAGTVATAARPRVMHPSSFDLNFHITKFIIQILPEKLIDLNNRMFLNHSNHCFIKSPFGRVLLLVGEKNLLLKIDIVKKVIQ